jgi:lysine 2,3-aminomutase
VTVAGLLNVLRDSQKARVHPYIRELLNTAEAMHGKDSSEYRGIYNQYFRMPAEELGLARSDRHYNALGDLPAGVERLYRRVAVVDLLTACSSECVFCIRGLYTPHTLSGTEINRVAEYLAEDEYLTEVLITGGDPLVAPGKLDEVVSGIAVSASNINVIRIGTRLPVQNPLTFDADLYEIFRRYAERFLFELSIQVNHPFELQPQAVEVINRLIACGARIYSQNVLLKGVNDDIDTLADLYDKLRSLRVIPHYLFHAVPIVHYSSVITLSAHW